MSDHPDYLSQFKDPRETIDPRDYVLQAEKWANEALDAAGTIDPAPKAAVIAQVALAKAIAGLAAALLATGTVKPGDDK